MLTSKGWLLQVEMERAMMARIVEVATAHFQSRECLMTYAPKVSTYLPKKHL